MCNYFFNLNNMYIEYSLMLKNINSLFCLLTTFITHNSENIHLHTVKRANIITKRYAVFRTKTAFLMLSFGISNYNLCAELQNSLNVSNVNLNFISFFPLFSYFIIVNYFFYFNVQTKFLKSIKTFKVFFCFQVP